MKIRKEEIKLNCDFPFMLSDTRMPPFADMGAVYHWHECLELSYVKEGKGRYYIGDRTYEMGPGDIIVINNIEPHYLEVDEEGMHQPVIVFNQELVYNSKADGIDSEYLKPFFERGTDFSNKLDPRHPLISEIKVHLARIENEFFTQPEGYRLMIKARLMIILTYLIRYFRDSNKTSAKGENKRQSLAWIEEAINYINEHFQEEISLDEMAARLFVSPQHFSATFRKVTGMTFTECINKIRVTAAIRLLTEKDRKVTSIALDCGFNNMANFNSIFKKVTGKTPRQLRGDSRQQ